MRVIQELETCKYCKGTGLEWDNEYSSDCRVCQGYGEIIVNIRKETENEKPTVESSERK